MILFNGSVDGGKLIPPWTGVQAKSPSRVQIVPCPLSKDDGHKWISITCMQGDHLTPTNPKERAQITNTKFRLAKGQRYHLALRQWFKAWNPIPASGSFNLPWQLISDTVGQSNVNIFYDAVNHGFQMMLTGGPKATVHTKFNFFPGLKPQGHLIDWALEIVPSNVRGQAFTKLSASLDATGPVVVVPPTTVVNMNDDLVGLWHALQIYRHGPQPQTDVVISRPTIICDSTQDVNAYFGYGSW